MQELNPINCEQPQLTSVQRVKKEFLNRVSNGEDAKEAFLASLSAINEKYNPPKDEYLSSGEERLGGITEKSFKLQPDSVTKWLAVIDMAIPIIEKIISMFTSFRKAPEGGNTNTDFCA